MRTTRGWVKVAMCCGALGLFSGCPAEKPPPGPEKPAEQDTEVSADEVREKLNNAAEAVEKYSAQETEKAIEDAQEGLENIRQRIDRLKADLGEMQEGAQGEFQTRIEQLEGKLQDAEQRLAELKDAGDEVWSEAEGNLQKAVEQLETAYQDAADALDQVRSETSPDESQTQPADEGEQEEPGSPEAESGS